MLKRSLHILVGTDRHGEWVSWLHWWWWAQGAGSFRGYALGRFSVLRHHSYQRPKSVGPCNTGFEPPERKQVSLCFKTMKPASIRSRLCKHRRGNIPWGRPRNSSAQQRVSGNSKEAGMDEAGGTRSWVRKKRGRTIQVLPSVGNCFRGLRIPI